MKPIEVLSKSDYLCARVIIIFVRTHFSIEQMYDDIVGISISIANVTFTDDLVDKSSENYRTLKDDVEKTVIYLIC